LCGSDCSFHNAQLLEVDAGGATALEMFDEGEPLSWNLASVLPLLSRNTATSGLPAWPEMKLD
jgi:hypothetical protein